MDEVPTSLVPTEDKAGGDAAADTGADAAVSQVFKVWRYRALPEARCD